ncbi:hypothetical protein F5Y16DRAFT_387857 [Xylariaceae sp. FL0255]|nr:hypothetical protein F5Y16DRAFT_387857 [Xylariaceae sp. FL0255]
MPSILNHIRRATRQDPATSNRAPPPYEPTTSLKDSPPPYPTVNPRSICTKIHFHSFAVRASYTAGPRAWTAKGSREALMSSIVNTFEFTMKEAYSELVNVDLPFDSAKWALLITAEVASLGSIQHYARAQAKDPASFHGYASYRGNQWDLYSKAMEIAVLLGMDQGSKSLSKFLSKLDTSLDQYTEIDDILYGVAQRAATTTMQRFFFNSTTRSQTIEHVARALNNGINKGHWVAGHHEASVPVFMAALAATLTASRSCIALSSKSSGGTCDQSKRWIAKTEKESCKAGVEAGRAAAAQFQPNEVPVHQQAAIRRTM